MKHIRDTIYEDFIELDDLALRAVSHPYFQRMRRIKHLGLTHYVYPGATHTRFSHMLGAYHLATKFLRSLQRKGYDVKRFYDPVRLAALLHDIGHTSLSHALEFTLLPFRHEDIGKVVIDLKFRKVLGDYLTDEILAIYSGDVEPFAKELVESQLDVDRLDYLRRDAYYCGVDYGLVDVERIIQTTELYPLAKGRTLAVSEKGIFAVESYIIARYLMYWSVYYHKTNLGFQALLFSLFKRVREVSEDVWLPDPLRRLMKAKSVEEAVDDFYKVDDPLIFYAMHVWSESGDPILSDLSRRVLNRERLKAVEIKSDFIEVYKRLSDICYSLGYDPNYYIIERTPKDVAYSLYDPQAGEHIKVIKDGKLRELSTVMPTDALKSLSREVVRKYVFVPEECWKVYRKSFR